MPRRETQAERDAWNAYMREYRKRNPHVGRANNDLPPTDRQLEILRAYAHPDTGGSYARVAVFLGISVSAVHNQMGRLMKRLGVASPVQAVYKL